MIRILTHIINLLNQVVKIRNMKTAPSLGEKLQIWTCCVYRGSNKAVRSGTCTIYHFATSYGLFDVPVYILKPELQKCQYT